MGHAIEPNVSLHQVSNCNGLTIPGFLSIYGAIRKQKKWTEYHESDVVQHQKDLKTLGSIQIILFHHHIPTCLSFSSH